MTIPEEKLVSKEQKDRLHEVADLMLIIYETLEEMRYIAPGGIVRGPHNIDKQRSTYEELKLDPAIIYLYSIMPYINEREAGVKDFFQGGAFFNHMEQGEVKQGRDPCYISPEGDYDDENGPYMYPWYTPLSECGNHSPIIIYDAREHRIWVTPQIDRHTSDPFFCRTWYEEDRLELEKPESTWGDSDGSSWVDDEGDGQSTTSGGSSEFWNDEDELEKTEELVGLQADRAEEIDWDEGFDIVEDLANWEREEAAQVKNQNSLEPVRHRAAGDVLRDINRWYRELKELPGQGEYTHGEWMEAKILKTLYRKNGWPEQFNGDQFQIDQVRAYAAQRASFFAEGPLQRVECHEGWKEYSDRDIDKYTQEIADAKDIDQEWLARFALWQAEERRDRNLRDLKEATDIAEARCPGGKCQKEEDLPLWEYEYLKRNTAHKVRSIEGCTQAMVDYPDQRDFHESNRRRATREAAVYEKALAESKADAERSCPGRTLEESIGYKAFPGPEYLKQIETSKKWAEESRERVQVLQNFAARVPKEATKALEAVEKEMEKSREGEKGCLERAARTQKFVDENGDLDY